MRLLVTAAALAALTAPSFAATYGAGEACLLHNTKRTAEIRSAVDVPSYLILGDHIIGPELDCQVSRPIRTGSAIAFHATCEGQGEAWETEATLKLFENAGYRKTASLTMDGTTVVLFDCGQRFRKKPDDPATKKEH